MYDNNEVLKLVKLAQGGDNAAKEKLLIAN